MRYGLCIFATHYAASPTVIAATAEDLGFESLWFPEHPCIPVDYSTPWPGSPDGRVPRPYWSSYDPFVALAFAAAATRRLRVATGICLVAQRDPIVTAKEVASLDVLSGGRFLFGVGAGWLKEEMILMGADYPRRWAQVKDKIAAMKRIWMADEASHSGEFVRFPAIKAEPKPVQKPHPPIHLGGNHPHSFRRVGEWADGWIPLRITPEEAKSGREKIAEHARSTGRDGSRIEVSIFGGPPDQAAQRAYGEAGVDRYVVFVPSHGPGDMERELSKLARELGLGR